MLIKLKLSKQIFQNIYKEFDSALNDNINLFKVLKELKEPIIIEKYLKIFIYVIFFKKRK